jgi:hypothetical protein
MPNILGYPAKVAKPPKAVEPGPVQNDAMKKAKEAQCTKTGAPSGGGYKK